MAVRREDFVIGGIPEDEVWDLDLTQDGQPACVLSNPADNGAEPRLMLGGEVVPLPPESLFRRVAPPFVVPPIVRWAGRDRVALIKSRAHSDESNGWIVNRAGEVNDSFHAGDDVEEVLANDDMILLFYGDEGQTGDVSLSREAMAVMSLSGEMLWGHRTQFGGKRGFDTWFHAAVWESRHTTAVFADVQHKCAFVRLNVQERRQQVWRPPAPIASPDAVTTVGDKVLAHGSGLIDEEDGQEMLQLHPKDAWVRELVQSGLRHHHIFEWIPGATTWQVIAEWPWQIGRHPPLRGLPGGRFIALKSDGYTILSFE